MLYGERGELFGYFLFKAVYTLHEVRVLLTQTYVFLL